MALLPQTLHSLSARWQAAPFVTGRVPSGDGWIAGDVGSLGSGLVIADDVLDVEPSIKHVIGCPMHPGVCVSNELLMLMIFTDPYLLPANMAGTRFIALAAATADTTLAVSLYQSGAWSGYGNIVIHASGAITLPTTAAKTLVPGDAIQIACPASADATLADFTLAIPIYRT